MARASQQTRCVNNQAGYRASSACSYAPNHSNSTNSPPPMRNFHKPSYSSSLASHSSTTIDSALSQSTLYSHTGVPSKGSKGYHNVSSFQTSFSSLLARARAAGPVPTLGSSSSKTNFLKTLFGRKRTVSKQASQGSLNAVGSSSQASWGSSQTPHFTIGSSSPKKNDSPQQQQPLTSFADLAYRYGSPSFKPLRL